MILGKYGNEKMLLEHGFWKEEEALVWLLPIPDNKYQKYGILVNGKEVIVFCPSPSLLPPLEEKINELKDLGILAEKKAEPLRDTYRVSGRKK